MGIQGYARVLKSIMTCDVAPKTLTGAKIFFDGNCLLYNAIATYIAEGQCNLGHNGENPEYDTNDDIDTFRKKIAVYVVKTILEFKKEYSSSEIIISFDGVPSMAKILEQKKRRINGYKSFYHNNKLIFCTVDVLPDDKIMNVVVEQLKNVAGLYIIDHTIAGEGEHKLFNYLKKNSDKINLIIGNDNDLPLLGMLLIAEMSEDDRRNKNVYFQPWYGVSDSNERTTPSRTYIYHINSCIEYFSNVHNKYSLRVSDCPINRRIWHFMYLTMLCGNDYVPRAGMPDIDTNILLEGLCKASVGPIITSAKSVDYEALYAMFQEYKTITQAENYESYDKAFTTSECLSSPTKDRPAALFVAAVEYLIMLEYVAYYFIKLPADKSLGMFLYCPWATPPSFNAISIMCMIPPMLRRVYEEPKIEIPKTRTEELEELVEMPDEIYESIYLASLKEDKLLNMTIPFEKDSAKANITKAAIFKARIKKYMPTDNDLSKLVIRLHARYPKISENPRIIDIYLKRIIDKCKYLIPKCHSKLIMPINLEREDYMEDVIHFYPSKWPMPMNIKIIDAALESISSHIETRELWVYATVPDITVTKVEVHKPLAAKLEHVDL